MGDEYIRTNCMTFDIPLGGKNVSLNSIQQIELQLNSLNPQTQLIHH